MIIYRRSNNIPFENHTERPDFVGMVLAKTKFDDPSCVCEIKEEGHIHDNYKSRF